MMMRISHRRSGKPGRTSTVLLAVLALTAGSAVSSYLISHRGSTTNSNASVTLTVLTPWAPGPEADAFQAMVNGFETLYPRIKVYPQPTRSLAAVLQSDVKQGTTPDLAVMPNAGALRTYATDGALSRLDKLVDADVSRKLTASLKSDYGQQWQYLMEAWTGYPYAVPIKVGLKSLIWYNKRDLGGENAATWTDLMSLSTSKTTPWCLALADPPSSGWPGTDWVEDILLHQAGWKVYDDWVQGNIKWSSLEVAQAWKTWGDIVKPGQVYGTAATALLTGYGASDKPMFGSKKPGCLLNHGALVPTSASSLKAGIDYDFFDFPSFNSQPQPQPVYEVSGDLMGIFHDSQAADEFIDYMAGADAQVIWPRAQPEQAFSANKQATKELVGLYSKPNVTGRINARLTGVNAMLCFDASDLMPEAMTNAFYRAVLQYVQDPGLLDGILKNLDVVQQGAYPSRGSKSSLPIACGTNQTTH